MTWLNLSCKTLGICNRVVYFRTVCPVLYLNLQKKQNEHIKSLEGIGVKMRAKSHWFTNIELLIQMEARIMSIICNLGPCWKIVWFHFIQCDSVFNFVVVTHLMLSCDRIHLTGHKNSSHSNQGWNLASRGRTALLILRVSRLVSRYSPIFNERSGYLLPCGIPQKRGYLVRYLNTKSFFFKIPFNFHDT